jgi:hypothetical protein
MLSVTIGPGMLSVFMLVFVAPKRLLYSTWKGTPTHPTHTHTHTHTSTQTHTHTQAHKHTSTQTHKHTDTHTYIVIYLML